MGKLAHLLMAEVGNLVLEEVIVMTKVDHFIMENIKPQLTHSTAKYTLVYIFQK